jgi:hypothetical protein
VIAVKGAVAQSNETTVLGRMASDQTGHSLTGLLVFDPLKLVIHDRSRAQLGTVMAQPFTIGGKTFFD